MTFILNLLHKEFSLIVGDTRATAAGTDESPAEVTLGEITLRAPKIVFDGAKKLFRSKSRNIALGWAGESGRHKYIAEFQKCRSVDVATSMIQRHIIAVDHSSALENDGSMMKAESGIMTYFDTASGSFFSQYYEFSSFYYKHFFHAGLDHPQLFTTGSGSEAFVKIFSKDEIRDFVQNTSSLDSLREQFDWIKSAYMRVNERDPGTGAEIVAYLASADSLDFRLFEA